MIMHEKLFTASEIILYFSAFLVLYPIQVFKIIKTNINTKANNCIVSLYLQDSLKINSDDHIKMVMKIKENNTHTFISNTP